MVPLFYDRDVDGLPRGWIAMMKNSIRILAPTFSGDRMVKQYAERFYLPAGEHYRRLAADGFAKAKELAAWKTRVREAWCDVQVTGVEERGGPNVAVGGGHRGGGQGASGGPGPGRGGGGSLLQPPAAGRYAAATATAPRWTWVGREGSDHLYRGTVPSRASGLHGYAVRVLPCHDDVLVPHELPLITWEQTEE